MAPGRRPPPPLREQVQPGSDEAARRRGYPVAGEAVGKRKTCGFCWRPGTRLRIRYQWWGCVRPDKCRPPRREILHLHAMWTADHCARWDSTGAGGKRVVLRLAFAGLVCSNVLDRLDDEVRTTGLTKSFRGKGKIQGRSAPPGCRENQRFIDRWFGPAEPPPFAKRTTAVRHVGLRIAPFGTRVPSLRRSTGGGNP